MAKKEKRVEEVLREAHYATCIMFTLVFALSWVSPFRGQMVLIGMFALWGFACGLFPLIFMKKAFETQREIDELDREIAEKRSEIGAHRQVNEFLDNTQRQMRS